MNSNKSARRFGVGIVGFGYWGPNLVRNFSEADTFDVRSICDKSDARLSNAARRYPHIDRTASFDELCSRPDIDLVAIATPISSHFPLAKAALLAGKDVFVEKPLCTTAAEAAELRELAEQRGRKIFVDHTFVYNPAVRKMRELVKSSQFGRPLYYDSVRANLGLFQSDFNVLWDLAPHDLSILDYVMDGAVPQTVSCVGVAHFGERQNLAYLSLVYAGGFIAHCHLSWLAPVKIRQVIFGGSKQFLLYDDNNPAERVRLYDKGVDIASESDGRRDIERVQYRVGDMNAPFVSNEEALKIEVEHIAACYRGEQQPITGISAGENIVRILELAERSMNDDGSPQFLDAKTLQV